MQKENVFVDKFFYADEIKKMKKSDKNKKEKKTDDQKKEKEGKRNG